LKNAANKTEEKFERENEEEEEKLNMNKKKRKKSKEIIRCEFFYELSRIYAISQFKILCPSINDIPQNCTIDCRKIF
jgi:hypothetical protein